MEKPTIEQLTGSWQLLKWVAKDGSEFTKNLHRWEFEKNGQAGYIFGEAGNTMMDHHRRNWKISEEPNADNNYSIVVNDKVHQIILALSGKLMVTKSADSSEITYYYEKAH